MNAAPSPAAGLRNGAAWVAHALEAEGVDTLFGYPGGAIMPFYDALVDSSLRHVLVRHEQGAAPAANGRQSSRPSRRRWIGWCIRRLPLIAGAGMVKGERCGAAAGPGADSGFCSDSGAPQRPHRIEMDQITPD